MRVKVTEQTILEYGLDTLTGNSKEDLLTKANEMLSDGYEMFVNIPDVEGGDKEAPTERNTFQHYSSDLPDPEGIARTQEAFNLSGQNYTREEVNAALSFDPLYGSPTSGQWVESPSKKVGQCSYGDCTEEGIWTRKEGWTIAPGSPEGDVCEKHHCWELIKKE